MHFSDTIGSTIETSESDILPLAPKIDIKETVKRLTISRRNFLRLAAVSGASVSNPNIFPLSITRVEWPEGLQPIISNGALLKPVDRSLIVCDEVGNHVAEAEIPVFVRNLRVEGNQIFGLVSKNHPFLKFTSEDENNLESELKIPFDETVLSNTLFNSYLFDKTYKVQPIPPGLPVFSIPSDENLGLISFLYNNPIISVKGVVHSPLNGKSTYFILDMVDNEGNTFEGYISSSFTKIISKDFDMKFASEIYNLDFNPVGAPEVKINKSGTVLKHPIDPGFSRQDWYIDYSGVFYSDFGISNFRVYLVPENTIPLSLAMTESPYTMPFSKLDPYRYSTEESYLTLSGIAPLYNAQIGDTFKGTSATGIKGIYTIEDFWDDLDSSRRNIKNQIESQVRSIAAKQRDIGEEATLLLGSKPFFTNGREKYGWLLSFTPFQ